jgi:hypothetical protein
VATTTIALKNAAVVINSTVDLSDQVQSVTLTVGYDQLETTAMGANGRSYTKGLQSVDATMTLFNSYGAAEVEASLEDIVGDDAVTLEIYPDGTSPGASNPQYTITGAFLTNFTPITGTVGDLSMVTVTFTGGTWARATS